MHSMLEQIMEVVATSCPVQTLRTPKQRTYLSLTEYSGEEWHSIKRGVKNGIHNGLKIVLDIESWDYASKRGAQGVNIALGSPTDKVAVNQVAT